MVALLPLETSREHSLWRIEGDSSGASYLRCSNFSRAAGCNWLRPAALPVHGECLCLACSLNRTIPDQSQADNLIYWAKIEAAKRRLVSQLLALKLPVQSKDASPWQDARGLAFDFLRDGMQPVTTGHLDGVITLNAQEADDAWREQARQALHEPARTLLGHLRHEIGHYYWQRLVQGTAWHAVFRSVFGSEEADYARALSCHYEAGAPETWRSQYVSAYASSHPWEDWAETWAHYLHMRDALDTAQSFQLASQGFEKRTQPFGSSALWDASRPGSAEFLKLVNDWLQLTSALNELSDSMGEKSFYPFVLSAPVVAKLQVVHEVIDSTLLFNI
jgi:hypothetical protein